MPFPKLLLTLNLRHGGGARVEAIGDWLVRRAPDIAVLTEYRDNAAGGRLGERLAAAGYALASASAGPGANGVLIASRFRIDESASVTPERTSSGELLMARIGGLAVLGCYFPGGKAKAPFFERCLALARAETGAMVMIGDFNTGCNLRDLAPGAARFDCADQFLDLERAAGLTDLWRATHGPDAREWTWFSRVANGYRLDHAFGNAAFMAGTGSEAHYLHDCRETGLSDHSALMVVRG
jgi:Exonuclease III